MKESAYARARDMVAALNRLRRNAARIRRGERTAHFDKDRRLVRSLWNDPNVVGFGVGPKISAGKADDFSVVIFVRRKLPASRLRNLIAIPKRLRLATLGFSVATDVQEWGGLPVAHAALPSGASIGDVHGNAGTMTLGVTNRSDGKPLILGCSHVMAQCGTGHRGDEIESPADLGSSPNVVGRLLRFTVIDENSPTNGVDAAVAQPADGIALTNSFPGISQISGLRDLTQEDQDTVIGLNVQKFGAVTGLQSGTIRNIHVATSIVYHQLSGDPSVDFIELVEYDCTSEEGDSGAAVLDTSESPSVVGMHIAGKADGTGSFFTHMRFVFDAMRISL